MPHKIYCMFMVKPPSGCRVEKQMRKSANNGTVQGDNLNNLKQILSCTKVIVYS